jgi:1-acyl-sn-glycerol-3-phosphate acyltransferase
MLLQAGVRPASPWLVRGFSAIARRRLRAAFRAVRGLHTEHLSQASAGPVIVYLNHPSWWDPLVCMAAAHALLPHRQHYAPISAESLKRYRIFGRIGMFPVEQDGMRGAAQFLRASQAVLASGAVLWITAQGHFTDARVRPAVLKSGLGALLTRLEQATVVPLAMEYSFWNQRLPEALIACAEPIPFASHTTQQWTALLQTHLEAAQDELATASLLRDPSAFHTLLEGGQGTAGVYGTWQRMRAKLRGERYQPDHATGEDVR